MAPQTLVRFQILNQSKQRRVHWLIFLYHVVAFMSLAALTVTLMVMYRAAGSDIGDMDSLLWVIDASCFMAALVIAVGTMVVAVVRIMHFIAQCEGLVANNRWISLHLVMLVCFTLP